MAKLNINVGQSDNDKTGDTLRTAFTKVNANFTELYTLTGGTSADLRELAQDYAAPLFNHASHTNITVTYDDANNKILLTGAAAQVQSNWTAVSGLGVILNKPTLFDGAYASLTGAPTIPAAAVWPVTNTAGASGPSYIAIGNSAGQGTQTVAIGYGAGSNGGGVVGTGGVAIGSNANAGGGGVGIGFSAGTNVQGQNAVALGNAAGQWNQGAYSIAIGNSAGAGITNAQAANTIILNATGAEVDGVAEQTNSFYVSPIRTATATSNVLYYNTTTKEVTYGVYAQSGATSAYATQRVLQYNPSTNAVTYSNTLDAVRAYITGYSSEIHVSSVAADDTGNGTIGDPVKTIARAQALAALAFETTAAGSRKTIVLHPGNYVEDVTISTQYTVFTTHELVGKNTTLSGTLTITKGCTIDGLKMTNLVISATSAFGSVDIIGCTVTTATTKTSTAYTVFRGCDLSSSTLSITGGGTTVMIGGNYFTLAVNNAAAGVLAKAVITMGPVTLTLGTLQLSDTLIYSATNTSYAITQSAYSVLTINNCQTLIPDLSNVSRISLNGFYSILSAVYDKPNSILAALSATGGSLNAIIYDQYINADRLILSTGGRITFPDATYQTTAWKGIPGPYADDAAAAAASVAVGNPYHKTGTSGQVFVRLT